jgi:DNA-binding GntR family transcriptional regulator
MEFETSSIRTYKEIRSNIISGQLRPGEKLARRTLAKIHGVSPITVMEAFYKLEIDGLVESRPMYGTRVRPLSRQHFIGEQVMREALECQCARLCALNLDDQSAADLQTLADYLDRRMGHNRGDKDMEEHAKFHVKVASISGMAILETEVQKIFFREFMWATWRSAQRISPPDGWHNRLLDAIRSGDPDRAEAEMRKHVTYNSEVLLDLLEKREASD